jgi:ATP-dependent DNA helicase RecQ
MQVDAMLGLGETVACRRSHLLHYFGQTIGPCGNCDNCLQAPETWDATVAAQKMLSAVYRLWKERGQRFGSGHLIDILRGKSTSRVLDLQHQTLSVFGVGQDLSEQAWRSVLRQLLASGMLTVDHEGYGTLALTDASRPVLKGEQSLMMRRESKPVVPAESSRSRKEHERLPGMAQSVFESLRAWRAEVARSHGVPAYVIFHDATLREIALAMPEDLSMLAQINGVGVRKLESYGQDILACVANHREDAAEQA